MTTKYIDQATIETDKRSFQFYSLYSVFLKEFIQAFSMANGSRNNDLFYCENIFMTSL